MKENSPNSIYLWSYPEMCDKKEINFKDDLEKALERWIEILDINWFSRFQSMLQKYLNINISKISFAEINDSKWIFIKTASDGTLEIYELNTPEKYGTNLSQIWIIKNSLFIEHSWMYKAFLWASTLRGTRNKSNSYEIPETPEVACSPDVLDKNPSSMPPLVENKTIDIKKWDSLWKIIEENYDIPNDSEKNRNIANVALRLEKLPENKKTIRKGTIFIGKPLFLPNEISTIRLPQKEEVKFSLKKEA